MTALGAHTFQAGPRQILRQAHPPAQRPHDSVQVQTTVNYTRPPPQGEQLFQYLYPAPNGERKGNLEIDSRKVVVRDIRTAQRQFSLHSNGFQLEPLQVDADIDWSDDKQVRSRS